MIAVHNGFSVRYLLQTDILAALRAKGAEIIVIVQGDAAALAHLAGEGVTVEGIPTAVGDAYASLGRLQRALRFIRHYTFGGWVQTLEEIYLVALVEADLDRQPLRVRLNMKLLRLVIRFARKSRWFRRRLLRLESARYCPDAYKAPIERYRPDLLVTASLGTFDYDNYLMRAARRMAIPSASVILSWDNTTTLGYPGAEPDHVVTWTDVMRDEAIRYADIPPERIKVGGIAHFDDYFREDPGYSRDDVKRGLGLDPVKRTILLVTKSPNGYAYNPNIAKMLGDAVADGRLPADVQVLVRIHPIHYRYRDGVPVYGGAIEAFRRMALENPALVINEPEIRSARTNSDMPQSEIRKLGRVIRTADVIVNIFSTLNIEGAIFDRPLVNVCFEGDRRLYEAPTSPRFNIGIDLRSTHNQRVINTGGVRMVYSPTDMIDAVKTYLDDPSRDREERARIVAQEVGPHRGNAGRFIGDTLYGWALARSRTKLSREDAASQ